jgi:hypothetical protein
MHFSIWRHFQQLLQGKWDFLGEYFTHTCAGKIAAFKNNKICPTQAGGVDFS